jgi:hopanoid biosynthesis associated RND transporter like protein HpnN
MARGGASIGVISKTGRSLRGLTRAACRYPVLTVALSLLVGGLSLAYTVHALRFETSTRALLPRGRDYVIRAEQYDKDFAEPEDIVVVVEAGPFEAARMYASRLVQRLTASPIKFRRMSYRVNPKGFEGRQLLYLSPGELRAIRDALFDHQALVESFVGHPTLPRLLEGIDTQMASVFVSNMFDLGLQDGAPPVDTTFVRGLLEQISTHLGRAAHYQSPWRRLFPFGPESADAGYFLSDDKSLLFILVEIPPGDDSFLSDAAAISTIRAAIASLRTEFPDVRAGVTGVPVLSNDEMSAAFHDSRIATALAAALTLLVMSVAFARVGKPLLMLAGLAVSVAWSLGVVTLAIGHLTLFSVMFISVVIGIGIDYGIYFLFRYEEERFIGRTFKDALEVTAARTGPGMLVGALTAGGSFFVLMLTGFRGIQELGFIAGIAILLAWLSMMTLFPAVLVAIDRRQATRRPHQNNPAYQRERTHVPLLDRLTRYPRAVLTTALVVTVLSMGALPFVGFDYNLLNLQAKGTESVAWEQRILASAGRSAATALTTATTLEDLRRKAQAFERLPSVSEVDSILRVIPDNQEEKIAVIASFAPLLASLRVGRPSPLDLDRTKRALGRIKLRFDTMIVEAGDKAPDELKIIRDKTAVVVRQLAQTNTKSAETGLAQLQRQLYHDIVEQVDTLQHNLTPQPVRLEDIPSDLRRRFVGASGRLLLQIHPKVNIWERQGAVQFVNELRSVDSTVTGAPVISYEATRLMERAYLHGTAYAFILVGALSFWMIRRILETLLALLPLVLGLLWTVGVMHVFGIRFNLANIWALPMIIGISAEFGLNVVLRYLEGRENGGPLVARSTVMGVVMNGFTTIVGFGSLMIAAHRGIFSLGLLLTVGSACGLVAALVVLPTVLRLVTQRQAPLAEADVVSYSFEIS